MSVMALVLVTACLVAAGGRPGGQEPSCSTPGALADRYRAAVVKHDPNQLVRLFRDEKLVCMDSFVPLHEIERSLQTRGTLLNTVMFDGEALRKREDRRDYNDESLAEFLSRADVRTSVEVEEPTKPGMPRRACIAFEGKDVRHDVCAECVRGEWVIYEWSYDCFVGQ